MASKKKTTRKASKKRPAKRIAKRVAMLAVECSIHSRRDVSQIVLDYLHGKGFAGASENSDFEMDYLVTPNARRAWGLALIDIVESRGCDPGTFGPEDCSNASTVGDIVNALAEALHVE